MKKSLSAILAAALLILSLSVGMVGTVSAAADGVLLDNCDSAPDGVFTGGWNQGGASMSVVTSIDAAEGTGYYNLVNVYNCYVQAGRTFAAPIETGFSNDNAAVSFWLYVDDVNKLANSSTVYLGLQNGGTPWDGEATYGAINFELKDLGFTSGKWHKIVLPISAGVNNGWFSANSIAAYNVYSGDATGSGVVLKLDDLRMVPYADGDATGIVQTVDLGTNVNPWMPEFPDEPFVITDGSAVPDGGTLVEWPGSGVPGLSVKAEGDRNADVCLNVQQYYGAGAYGGINLDTAVDTGYLAGYAALSAWVYAVNDGQAFDFYLYDSTTANGTSWGFPTTPAASCNGTGIKAGWNKVILPITGGNLADYKGFAFVSAGNVEFAIDEVEIIPFVQGDASGVIEAGVQIKVPDLIPTVIDGCEYGAGPAVEGDSAWDISVNTGDMAVFAQQFETVINSGFSSKNAANGAVSFWIYVDNKDAMVNATTSYFDISSDGKFDGLGTLQFAIPWADMTNGKWNKVVLPLSSGTAAYNYDYTKIAGWRLVIWVAGGASTVKIDDIRTVAYAAGDATGVVEVRGPIAFPTQLDGCEYGATEAIEGQASFDASVNAGDQANFVHTFNAYVDTGFSLGNVENGAVSFWIYVTDKTAMANSTSSYLEINTPGNFDGLGGLTFSIPWEQMTNYQWNRVVIPFLQGSATNGFDYSTIRGWRIVIWNAGGASTVYVDDLRTVSYTAGDATGVVEVCTPIAFPTQLDGCEYGATDAVEGYTAFDASVNAGDQANFVHTFNAYVDTGFSLGNFANGAVSFWVYVSNKEALANAAATYLEINTLGNFDGLGGMSFSIPWANMVNNQWNKVVIPFSQGTAAAGFDYETIRGWRIVIWAAGGDSTVKIDDLRTVNYAAGDPTGVVCQWSPAETFPKGTTIKTLGSRIRTGDAYAKAGQQALCFGTQIDRIVENGVEYVSVLGKKFQLKSFGTLLMVTSKVTDVEDLVVGENKPDAAIDIPGINLWESGEDYLVYTGVLINIDEEHFDTAITARAYMVISDGVNDYTVYGDAISRSVNYTQLNSGEKGTVYTLDFDRLNATFTHQDVQYDTIKFIVSLQGLLNREKPALFVMDGTSQRWFDYLREDEEKLLYGYRQESLSTTDQVIKAFEQQIKDFGLVVWDKNLPATANVAATVCGVDGYLPVMYSENQNSMYRILTEQFGVEVKLDLRGKFTGNGTVWQTTRQSTGSAKCDAYIWAIEKYVKTGKTSPDYVGFMGDAYPLTTGNTPAYLGGSVYEMFLPDHDFMIARKAFIFDLSPWNDETPIDDPNQPLGTDYAVMCELLTLQAERNNGKISQCIGYVPFAYKYSQGNGSSHGPVDAEWRTTEILTAHNIALQADCPGPSSMWNCSLYQHFPLKESYKQVSNKNPELPTFDPNKKYVYLYMGDYDAASWTASIGANYWDSEARGQMPFNWAFNPNLSDRIPMFFDYIYSTATPNDYFTAGDSGAGYVNPTLLEAGKRIHSTLPDATQAWVDWCKPLYQKFDIDTTAFVLNGSHGMISANMMAAYQQFSPRGIAVYGSYNPRMYGNMPVVEAYGLGSVGGTAVTVDELISGIRSAVSRSRSLPFYHIRTVVVSPDVVLEAAKQLKTIDPSIEFLDAYTYYGMIARELNK